MTHRHKKVVDEVRRAIENGLAKTLQSSIDENKIIQAQALSSEARSLRLDLGFVASTFWSQSTVMIDI
jgi:hypothetical protein